MKLKTANQINSPQVGESELRPGRVFDQRRFFEEIMNHFGYKLMNVIPPKGFTAKVMRRIRKTRKAKK